MRTFFITSLAVLALAGCKQSPDNPSTAHQVVAPSAAPAEKFGEGKFFHLARRNPEKHCFSIPPGDVEDFDKMEKENGFPVGAIASFFVKVNHGSMSVSTYLRQDRIIFRRVEKKGRGFNQDIVHDECFLLPA